MVLPDGRYIIEGGEYNLGNSAWTNMGAIYDPVKNKWTAVNPPAGWSQHRRCPSHSVGQWNLHAGRLLQWSQPSLLQSQDLKWTNITNTGKADRFDEEGWGLLPNGDVLTVDAIDAPNSEVYNPATKKWTSAGSTIVRLEDPSSQEVGPLCCGLTGPSSQPEQRQPALLATLRSTIRRPRSGSQGRISQRLTDSCGL